jgi:hypothetical protein
MNMAASNKPMQEKKKQQSEGKKQEVFSQIEEKDQEKK